MAIRGKILATTIPFFILLGLVTMFLSVRSLQVQGEHSLATIEEVMTKEKNEKLRDLVRNTFEILADRYRAAHDPEQVAAAYEKELQAVVNLAYSTIEAISGDQSLSREEQMNRALEIVKNMRYQGSNYLWINDLQPTMVMHPINPALDGQDLTGYQDPQGKKLFVEMADLCRRDGDGFVSYLWPKPGEEKPVAKLSYVRLFEPWDWVIGTGVYLELAEQRFKREAREQIGKLRFGANNDDYFFIVDTDVNMVMHPINPALDGKNMDDYKDPDGTYLFREMVSVSRREGEGFVRYRWPKPGEQEPVAKQSFVKLFDEWGWIVGTGIYIDDIDKAMAAQRQDVADAVKRQRTWIIAVSVSMIVVVSLVMFFVAASISRPIRRAAEMLKDIAEGEGDLTRRLAVTTKDELADMARWFNTFVEKLQGIIAAIAGDAKDIKGSAGQLSEISAAMAEAAGSTSAKSETVAAAVEEMSANMGTVARSMENTAANVDMVAAAVEEMTSTINEIAETSEKARAITGQAEQQAATATAQVDALGTAAHEISSVLASITDISDQVDLLALNATIEAARAGDAGKGFAVVAAEIKELARQTAEAAGQIEERIIGIQQTTGATVAAIEKISRVIGDNSDIVNTIATAVEEQSATAGEISQNVSQISSGIQEINVNVAESSQVSAEIARDIAEVNQAAARMNESSREVSQNAGHLNERAVSSADLVARFKV